MYYYNNFYQAPVLNVQIQNIFLTTTRLSLQVKIQPTESITMAQGDHYYYAFRFYL